MTVKEEQIMTREDVKKILGEGATDDQVTAVLDSFHAEQKGLTSQISDLQGQVTNLTTEKTELLGYKTKVAELEKSQLSEQEKMELEKKELELNKKKYKILTNSVKAKSILVGAGLGEEEAEKIVASIVKEDEQATIDSANLFATQFNTIKENTAKATREELANLDLKPNSTNIPPNSDEMTWDKFNQLSETEQNKFADEHPDEFAKL